MFTPKNSNQNRAKVHKDSFLGGAAISSYAISAVTLKGGRSFRLDPYLSNDHDSGQAFWLAAGEKAPWWSTKIDHSLSVRKCVSDRISAQVM